MNTDVHTIRATVSRDAVEPRARPTRLFQRLNGSVPAHRVAPKASRSASTPTVCHQAQPSGCPRNLDPRLGHGKVAGTDPWASDC